MTPKEYGKNLKSFSPSTKEMIMKMHSSKKDFQTLVQIIQSSKTEQEILEKLRQLQIKKESLHNEP